MQCQAIIRPTLVAVAAAVVICGCSQKSTMDRMLERADYYAKHLPEMREKAKECRADWERRKLEDDCAAADYVIQTMPPDKNQKRVMDTIKFP